MAPEEDDGVEFNTRMVEIHGRQRAQVELIKDHEYILPSKEIIIRFGETVKPVFESVYLINCQNIRLAESRDRLIAKLISSGACMEETETYV